MIENLHGQSVQEFLQNYPRSGSLSRSLVQKSNPKNAWKRITDKQQDDSCREEPIREAAGCKTVQHFFGFLGKSKHGPLYPSCRGMHMKIQRQNGTYGSKNQWKARLRHGYNIYFNGKLLLLFSLSNFVGQHISSMCAEWQWRIWIWIWMFQKGGYGTSGHLTWRAPEWHLSVHLCDLHDNLRDVQGNKPRWSRLFKIWVENWRSWYINVNVFHMFSWRK